MTLPVSLAEQMDPVYAAWLEATNPPLPAGFVPTLEQMREGFERQEMTTTAGIPKSMHIRDSAIFARAGHRIPIRHYQHRTGDSDQPCCVYVHGGGWVLGNLETHHGICLDLAQQTGLTVIAIDYRLSPEHRFPAAIEDVVDVLKHLQTHAADFAIDPTRISLCGDSAGAGIAMSACLMLRRTSALPVRLAQIYPAVGADIERPSFIENRDIPGLSRELMRFFFLSYIGNETLPDLLAAPLLVEDLQSLPPVFISGAQFDPLRDDASDLATRLRTSGVETQLRIEPGLGHGYLWVRRQSAPAAEAFRALAGFLAPDRR